MGRRTKRVAFIPVRGGSKSIPKKNIRPIAGKPLVFWVVDAALQSGVFDDIYISTDDKEIADVIETHPQLSLLTLVNRSAETATDTASTESAMLEFAGQHDFDCIALIQATSPLLQGRDLKEGMQKFTDTKGATSLLSVCRQERFLWNVCDTGFAKPKNYDPDNRPRRQDFDGFLVENGAFYITDKDSLLTTKSRISGNIITYEMPPEAYYELDEPSDWTVIEALLNNRKVASLNGKLQNIKLFLTDVDGVLTDAGMYYSEKGDELKKFNTRDGKGFELLRKQGIEVGIITSEDTKLVSARARKLQVNILHQGITDKGQTLTGILADLNLPANQVAYIGDDINDIPILERVGFSAAPADTMEKIRSIVDYVCSQKGGEGCVREVAELILKANKTL